MPGFVACLPDFDRPSSESGLGLEAPRSAGARFTHATSLLSKFQENRGTTSTAPDDSNVGFTHLGVSGTMRPVRKTIASKDYTPILITSSYRIGVYTCT